MAKKKRTKKTIRVKPVSPSEPNQMNIMKKSAIKFKGGASRWMQKAATQKENVLARYAPKFLLFGAIGTGKTHVGGSAYQQKRRDGKLRYTPDFSPVRILDLNRSASLIIPKDFPDAFSNGEAIVINPYVKINDEGQEIAITHPIERCRSVNNLVKECSDFSDGCLVIDGFDAYHRDAMYYIYRQYKMFKKEDGTLWKRQFDKKTGEEIEPASVTAIVQWQYGPRNTAILNLLYVISQLTIPVILIGHPQEVYINNQATGIIRSNLRSEIEDDMDCIIQLQNFKRQETKKIGGRSVIEETPMRRMIIKKNRFQKGGSPDMRVIEREKFEFTDIFDILAEAL